jgi:hypothetical protein
MSEMLLTIYSAPLGKSTVVMTAIGCTVMLGVALIELLVGLRTTGTVRTVSFCVAAYLLLMFGASFLLKIRGYELTDADLIVRWGFWKKQVPLSEIASARRDESALRGSTRAFANGGFWSFLGKFSNPRLGQFDVYLSDVRRAIVLELRRGCVVVSPGDPEAFLAELTKRGVRTA